MKRSLVALAVTGVLSMGAPMAVLAQDATPAAITGVPDPAECTVEARSLEEFQAALATPVAEVATPAALPETPSLPEGEPVDAEVEAAVLATLREVVACFNAGEIWSALALYSADLVRTLFGDFAGISDAFYEEVAGEEPPVEDERTEIIEVQGVVMLPDGRVATLVVGNDRAEPGGPSPTLFVFVEQDGRWVIDDFVETPEEGTPTP